MSPLIAPAPAWAGSTGLLLVRLAVGVAFVMHGWPKLQNPFGWMNAMGMDNPAPGILQATGACIEVGGGILLAVGFLTRAASLLLAAQMVAALALVHIPHHDPFVAQGRSSAELAIVYLAVSLAVAALGAGAYSLDALLFERERMGSPSPAAAL